MYINRKYFEIALRKSRTVTFELPRFLEDPEYETHISMRNKQFTVVVVPDADEISSENDIDRCDYRTLVYAVSMIVQNDLTIGHDTFHPDYYAIFPESTSYVGIEGQQYGNPSREFLKIYLKEYFPYCSDIKSLMEKGALVELDSYEDVFERCHGENGVYPDRKDVFDIYEKLWHEQNDEQINDNDNND